MPAPSQASGSRSARSFLIFGEYKVSGTEFVFGAGSPPHHMAEDWVKGERGRHRSLQPFRAFCTMAQVVRPALPDQKTARLAVTPTNP